MKLKLKCNLEVRFSVDSKWYPKGLTPDEIAKLEEKQFSEDPGVMLDIISSAIHDEKHKVMINIIKN